MTSKRAALVGVGAFVAFWASDYFFAKPGPARIVVVDQKFEGKRDLICGNDDVTLPPILTFLLPSVPQIVMHEQIMGVEHGKLPVSEDLYGVVKKGDTFVLRYKTGKFSHLVYDAHLEPGMVRELILQRKVAAKEGLDSPPTSTPSGSPQISGGISVADAPSADSGTLTKEALAARYNSSDPQARLRSIIDRTSDVGRNPSAYNSTVTSGDEGLDQRLTKIRHASMSGRSDSQKEIQLEVSELIIEASDPVLTPGGRMAPEKAAKLSQLVDLWDRLADAPASATSSVEETQSKDPTDRLKAIVPRLKKQLNRQYMPFVQWDAVAAKSDAEQLLKSISARGRVSDEEVDRLVADLGKMERIK